ncbi:MAG: membrane protein insertase YidC [Treponema sp.]|jgi:YidC/Oxa1 family membrane protein insertase|nr:membrane protein insertase YidC [Treponema sp.]
MEKNTVLAVVLSSIVLIAFFAIQNALTPPPSPVIQPEQSGVVATDSFAEESIQIEQPVSPSPAFNAVFIDEEAVNAELITIQTEVVTVVLTNAGGDMVSWKLKSHLDHDENVDMIFSGDKDAHAFSIAFGGMDTLPVSSLFHVNRISEHTVEFYRDFSVPGTDTKFRLLKRYDFKPNDYMFELTVTLEGDSNVPGFNFSGDAYTLAFGPQIGPKFEKLNVRYDYRQYHVYTNGKRRSAKVNNVIDTRPTWAAISGKYFTFIAIPHLAQFSAVFTETREPGIPSASRLSIIRPAVNQRTVTDTYKFYLGPKSEGVLKVYHSGLNDFKFKESSLTEMASSRGVLAPLEIGLKWLLLLCYKIVPNYGVAIILLTLMIKIVFFPLTKKSSEATSRMQELAPKIKEIQEKYKGNPQKLNAEMATFYQKEGYNPISGCLPMLLQIPIFIAMYNLFNNHFDLRGASFIPGWIPDLSVPEYIVNFPDGFQVPILGWTALRALPFIYVGSQLMYGKITQAPGQQTAGQMKMMLYIMPIAFFFILYNVPSGLLLYWIFSNAFTLVQQVIINKYKKSKAPPPDAPPQYVVAPKKKKR